jgi:hypothetical protein
MHGRGGAAHQLVPWIGHAAVEPSARLQVGGQPDAE